MSLAPAGQRCCGISVGGRIWLPVFSALCQLRMQVLESVAASSCLSFNEELTLLTKHWLRGFTLGRSTGTTISLSLVQLCLNLKICQTSRVLPNKHWCSWLSVSGAFFFHEQGCLNAVSSYWALNIRYHSNFCGWEKRRKCIFFRIL